MRTSLLLLSLLAVTVADEWDQPDPYCLLPPQEGSCTRQIPRYYYNTKTGYCERFFYGGCGGNFNNFRKLRQCVEACNAGVRDYYPNTPPRRKSSREGYHVNSDICSLPKIEGPCMYLHERYYFNQRSGKCEKFIYGGCKGNANNFRSRQRCQEKCPEEEDEPELEPEPEEDICWLPLKVGPCRKWKTRYFFNTTSGECDRFRYGGCKGNRNNFFARGHCEDVCLRGTQPMLKPKPKPENRCLLRKNKGPCRKYETRYYFHMISQKCRQFTYGGCRGNRNNFLTLHECKRACRKHFRPTRTPSGESETRRRRSGRHRRLLSVDVCALPKKEGPCLAFIPRYYFSERLGRCVQFIYGGCFANGNNFDTLEQCQYTCVEARGKDCSLPKEAGPCTNSTIRYFFNTTSKTCQEFRYGGCEGNRNNFNSITRCQRACVTGRLKLQSTCSLPKRVGHCKDYVRRFFYNKTARSCDQFMYGGCGGNSNNFVKYHDCQEKCEKGRSRSADICSLAKDVGPCKKSIRRYYFNVTTGECDQFLYGGCGGNQNNFVKYSQCQEMCEKGDKAVPEANEIRWRTHSVFEVANPRRILRHVYKLVPFW